MAKNNDVPTAPECREATQLAYVFVGCTAATLPSSLTFVIIEAGTHGVAQMAAQIKTLRRSM